jgi:Uma2 family endonuclease
MTTATTTPPAGSAVPPLAGLVNYVRPGERLVLTGVEWADYEQLLDWRDDHRRTVRLTYDQGRLEIMVVSNFHERLRKVLALLIEAWLEETDGDDVPSGQLTHKREDLKRGFEPDECYYVQNWTKVAGLREIDFETDPPPDLTVEVEVSRSVLGRLPVFAAFNIPEVWRYDGERVTVLLLGPDGTYHESPTSRAVPNFPFADAPRFLGMAAALDQSFATIGRQFRAWARSLPPAAPPPDPPFARRECPCRTC